MVMHELPADWDWVTAVSECSARTFFERLRVGAEKNIAKRAELFPPDSARTMFKITSSGGDVVSILSESHGGPVVRLRLKGRRISVDAEKLDVEFEGVVTLNKEGKCRLRLENGEELDEWQVLKRALEPLLFQDW
jgi:hypothetical protein